MAKSWTIIDTLFDSLLLSLKLNKVGFLDQVN